jgi:hypothetical protein
VPKLKYYYLEKSKGFFYTPMPIPNYNITEFVYNQELESTIAKIVKENSEEDSEKIWLSEFIKSTSLTDNDYITGSNFQNF